MPHATKDVPCAPVKKLGKAKSCKIPPMWRVLICIRYAMHHNLLIKARFQPILQRAEGRQERVIVCFIEHLWNQASHFVISGTVCITYIPRSLDSSFPSSFSELYIPECLYMQYSELVKICERCNITSTVTQLEADAVESAIKSQTQSQLWFTMRTGRITASHVKAAGRTDQASPSISLFMSVCHPEMSRFKQQLPAGVASIKKVLWKGARINWLIIIAGFMF